MSTAGISSSSLIQGAEYFQDRKSDLQQLGQALQAGNLAGAQQDFATIQNLGQNGPFANGNAFAVAARQQDFNAIGQALQSGDLAGAQTALTQLQSTFQPGGSTGPVLDPGPAVIINISAPAAASTTSTTGATSPATTAPATTTPATNTTAPASTAGPEIVLNLGSGTGNGPEEITISLNNSSSGEQLTIGVGTQQNPNAQQLTFNLAQNTNEQIILNLGAPAASSTSATSSTASAGATTTPGSSLNVLA
jgi:hypothetical protein